MRTHGGLTEDSRTDSLRAPIGKGREGKGSGKGTHRVASLPLFVDGYFQNQVQSVTREDWTWR